MQSFRMPIDFRTQIDEMAGLLQQTTFMPKEVLLSPEIFLPPNVPDSMRLVRLFCEC